jgi:hypothetical protein
VALASTSTDTIATWTAGLALRILYNFFVDTSQMRFDSFVRLCHWDGLIPQQAIDCCLAALADIDTEPGVAKKQGILLLVDEVIKLQPRTTEMVTSIGHLLGDFPSERLNIVCTSLNARPFWEVHTSSGRFIHWAPLPALPLPAAMKMLAVALNLPADRLPLAVQIALSDCAGHPRSQQYVMQAAVKLQKADPKGWAADESEFLAGLRQSAITQLGISFSAVDRGQILYAALAGIPRDQNLTLYEGSHPLASLISSGEFLNTDAHKWTAVVPKLSMLRMLADSTSTGSALGGAIQALGAQDIAALKNPHRMGGTPFEKFISHWLRIRLMAAAQVKKDTTLKQVFIEPLRSAGVQNPQQGCELDTVGASLPTDLTEATLIIPPVIGFEVGTTPV